MKISSAMPSDSEHVYVINGFYAAMRSKYTSPGSSVYYYSVEWNAAELSWSDFRSEVLGATDPETAVAGSMRREIMSMAGVVLVVAIDAAVADLADLFGLCGSLGLGTISLVLPALMYLWNYNKDGRTRTSVHVLGSAVTLALGLTVTFGTTGVILHGLFV